MRSCNSSGCFPWGWQPDQEVLVRGLRQLFGMIRKVFFAR